MMTPPQLIPTLLSSKQGVQDELWHWEMGLLLKTPSSSVAVWVAGCVIAQQKHTESRDCLSLSLSEAKDIRF